jgi:ribosomal-protein-alanine N-acetyltransferase
VLSILARSPEAAQWSEQAIANALAASPGYHLVGIVGGQVAGFISGRRIAVEGEILNLAVKPEFRRQGIGHALVRVILGRFHRDGVRQVFLEVRESNDAAISFYQRLGFHRIGRREAYYSDPPAAALVLVRPMAPQALPLADPREQVP